MEIILRDILPSDVPSLAHILIEANEHAFRGLVPDRCLEFSEAESTANWDRFFAEGLPIGDFMIAAINPNGEMVGYIWGGPNTKEPDYAGELRQISVLPAYQGQGIGRRLACRLAQRLLSQNLRSMRVEVLHVNPNRAFYERLGGVLVSEQPYDWDGVILPMCIYGWNDSRLLINESIG